MGITGLRGSFYSGVRRIAVKFMAITRLRRPFYSGVDIKHEDANSDPILRRLQIIRIKLRILYDNDVNYKLFGSSTHKYVLNKCLTESEVRAFEEEYGVSLPEEYRKFLLFLGNGGAGPYYGLLPLEKFNEHYVQHMDDIELEKSFLNLDFPHTEQWRWDLKSEEYEELEKRNKGGAYGTLALCHEGCAYYDLLIVTGQERGNIWFDGMAGDGGMMPLTGHGGAEYEFSTKDGVKIYDFLTWYESWLDKSLEQCGSDGAQWKES